VYAGGNSRGTRLASEVAPSRDVVNISFEQDPIDSDRVCRNRMGLAKGYEVYRSLSVLCVVFVDIMQSMQRGTGKGSMNCHIVEELQSVERYEYCYMNHTDKLCKRTAQQLCPITCRRSLSDPALCHGVQPAVCFVAQHLPSVLSRERYPP
jgi:hypothetical protein